MAEIDFAAIGRVAALAPPGCRCSFRTRLVGDGCENCNPRYAVEVGAEMGSISDGREPVPYVSAETRAIEALALTVVALSARLAVLEAAAGYRSAPARALVETWAEATVEAREAGRAAGPAWVIVETLAARGR